MPEATVTGSDGPLITRVSELAGSFADQRRERQARRTLDRADFEALAEAGYLGIAVPEAQGGLFDTFATSTRRTAEILRTLARRGPCGGAGGIHAPRRARVLAGRRGRP